MTESHERDESDMADSEQMGSTDKIMTVKAAADQLNSALKSLESALDPMISRLDELQKNVQDYEKQTRSGVELRADMQEKLDAASDREEQYKNREKEFASLAQETTRELDNVISQVLRALGDDDELREEG